MSLIAPSVRSVLAEAMTPDQRYDIVRTLGEGNSGTVYQVRDRLLDEVIALKVLHTTPGDDEEAVAHCHREIKIARRLRHPNIASIYELCVFGGRFAISQELIDGTTLEVRLMEGPLDLDRVHHYMRYLCSALDCAHRVGVVHGDFKPANVILDAGDVPHVVDFGTALLAGAPAADGKRVRGTSWYLAPEQVSDCGRIDTRSDIYSLGVVLYRMLSGELPFRRGTLAELLAARPALTPAPLRSRRPSIHPAVEQVVMGCLEKRPEDRPVTASRLFEDLDRARATPDRAPRPRRAAAVRSALVIDVDGGSRQELAALLRELGAEVTEAADAYRGIELALAERPQLIFVDRAMPEVDGFDLLRILQANAVTAGVPVVMTLAGDAGDEILLATELGAAFTLVRPLQADVVELVARKLCAATAATAPGKDAGGGGNPQRDSERSASAGTRQRLRGADDDERDRFDRHG